MRESSDGECAKDLAAWCLEASPPISPRSSPMGQQGPDLSPSAGGRSREFQSRFVRTVSVGNRNPESRAAATRESDTGPAGGHSLNSPPPPRRTSSYGPLSAHGSASSINNTSAAFAVPRQPSPGQSPVSVPLLHHNGGTSSLARRGCSSFEAAGRTTSVQGAFRITSANLEAFQMQFHGSSDDCSEHRRSSSDLLRASSETPSSAFGFLEHRPHVLIADDDIIQVKVRNLPRALPCTPLLRRMQQHRLLSSLISQSSCRRCS